MTDEDGIRDDGYEDRDLYPGYYAHTWHVQHDPITHPPMTFTIRIDTENNTAADKATFVSRLRAVAFNTAPLTDPEAYIRVL